MKQGCHCFLLAVSTLAVFGFGSNTLASELVDVSNQANFESVQIGVMNLTPEAAARHFLQNKAAELNLAPDLSNLILESVTTTPVGSHVRFSQVKNRLPVDGAKVVVTLNHSNQVLTYINDAIPSPSSAFESVTRFDLSAEQALQIAYRELKLTASPVQQEVTQKIVLENGVSRSAYQINLSAPLDKVWAWEILIDASNARIYRSETRAYNAHSARVGVTAAVFEPNPTLKSGKAYGQTPGYDDSNHGNTPFFDRMLTQINLDNLTQKAGKYTLSGPNVQITDLESPTNPNCDVAKTDMSYKRDNPCLVDVSAYYFADKMLKYLNGPLGFHVHPLKYTGGIKIDPHGVNGDDNSHYNQNTDILAFGDGGVPDAQDHDVVIHELGHAIHSWLTGGHLSQKDGLSEGIGDYWLSSHARQYAKPGDVAYHWTFSYDGHNKFWPGRINNVSGSYPSAVQGEIHEAGQMWASVCMDVYDAIGKLKTDKIHWTAIAMLNATSGQLDAAKAFVVATRQLYGNEPQTIASVLQKFQNRGFAVK